MSRETEKPLSPAFSVEPSTQRRLHDFALDPVILGLVTGVTWVVTGDISKPTNDNKILN